MVPQLFQSLIQYPGVVALHGGRYRSLDWVDLQYVYLVCIRSFIQGVTIGNLQEDEVMLAGNLASILSSGLVCTIVSIFKPDDCDWSTTKTIPLIEDEEERDKRLVTTE